MGKKKKKKPGPDLRPMFRYYGAKWRDAKRYPEPRHETLIEPFAGSAGYALRHWRRRVILCDLDEHIAATWRYLLRVLPAEILALPDIEDGQSVDDLDVPPEARVLIGWWLNCSSAPRKTPSAWMMAWRDRKPGSVWSARTRERIARQVEQIRHWRFVQADYREIDHVGRATWFVDPPYQGMGKHYRHGPQCLDYDALGAWCRGREGQVIVCENEGADWLPFDPLHYAKTSRVGKRSAEVIWTNSSRGQHASR